jgi:hypothetical protein
MPSIQQDIVRDDSNTKQSLIYEGVAVIRIGVQPAGKEPDQYVVRMASRVSCMTTVREVPTKSKLGPCSQDEVLAPSDRPTRSSSWAAYSPYNKPP